MSYHKIKAQLCTHENFTSFGDIIALKGKADKIINQGKCERHHDLANLDIDIINHKDGKTGISVFKSQIRTFPYTLDMMERHPLGSQAFIPMCLNRFLVIVAEDEGGKPALPKAFLTQKGQGINIHRNVWHGVLTPIEGSGLFAVIDRIGEEPNLEEFWFDVPYIIEKP